MAKFKKGKSGNPGGRPKLPEDVKAALEMASVQAVVQGVALMTAKKTPASVAADLSKYFIDRRWGKVPQAVELSGKDGNPIQTEDVTTPMELARRIALILTRAEKG